MFDEFVRDAEAENPDIYHTLFLEHFQHSAAETAHEDVFLDSDQSATGRGNTAEEFMIQGLDEAGVDYRGVDAFRQQFLGRCQGREHRGPDGSDGQVFPFAQYFTFSKRDASP